MMFLSAGSGLSMKGWHSNFGVMTSPSNRMCPLAVKQGRLWAMDNEAFTLSLRGETFKLNRWLDHWHKVAPFSSKCLFLVIPDAVASSEATIKLWKVWSPVFRLFCGDVPLAFVAQNGQENLPFPADCQAIFIGGSTEWKLSPMALEVISRAKQEGKWVHIGRVNTIKRFRHFELAGADSCDGTGLARFTKKYLPMFTNMVAQPSLLTV